MESPSPARAESRSSAWRAAVRVGGLALWFLACLPLHLGSKLLLGRSRWPSLFLGVAGRIAGARVRTVGTPPRAHSLLVSNHVSWMDILILGGATGCAFVSKDSLGNAFIHWLADQNATLYVRRSERRGARDQALAIARALDGPQPIAVFPEGTTGPGTHLLPFRPTLLEAASYASRDVEVRPVAVDYGSAAGEIAWHDEAAKANVLRLLGRKGRIDVTVRLLDALPGVDRKVLAEQARSAIAAALGASSPAHPAL